MYMVICGCMIFHKEWLSIHNLKRREIKCLKIVAAAVLEAAQNQAVRAVHQIKDLRVL